VPPTANLNIVGIVSQVGRQFSNIRTQSTRILPPFMNRRGVMFHSPGTAPKAMSPGNIPARIGAGSVILMPGAAREFRALGKVRMNNSFNAITANDCDRTLTALVSV